MKLLVLNGINFNKLPIIIMGDFFMNILITGARSGIARDLILKLLKSRKSSDYKIYATTHTIEQKESLESEMSEYDNVFCFKLDITDKEDVKLIENMDIDILVCNAAIGISGSLIEIPIYKVKENFNVNVFSNLELIQLTLKNMLKNQILKCTTSGFLTGFGGIITLPITIPTNIGSVLYVQMRMIACTAYLAGYDLKSDQVQTFVYACLAGVSVNQLIKKVGIEVGKKVATNAINKIPGKTLTKINQKIGYRFITKFGQKGSVNLGKMIPGVGAVVGGGLDYLETKAIAKRAYKMFFDNDFIINEEVENNE